MSKERDNRVGPRAIVIVMDGLRIDSIKDSRTPFLARIREEGTIFTNAHSVFPSSTRVCAATIASGCYPQKHGIPENTLIDAGSEFRQLASCADVEFLQSLCSEPGGRLIPVPTMPEILASAGLSFFAGSSGSTGTGYLLNPQEVGVNVHWTKAWPHSVDQAFRANVEFPPRTSSTHERNSFIITTALRLLHGESAPDVMLLWFTEPDEVQHNHALGSQRWVETLRELDRGISHLHDELLMRSGGEAPLFLLLSDHGAVTPLHSYDLARELVRARMKATGSSTDVLVTDNSVFVEDASRVPELVKWLADCEAIDAVLVRDDHWKNSLPALPLSILRCAHPRAADIMLSFASTDEPNRFGIAGVTKMVGNCAMHGSISPFEASVPLFAYGGDVPAGVSNNTPCGLIDVLPTVLAACDVHTGPAVDGMPLPLDANPQGQRQLPVTLHTYSHGGFFVERAFREDSVYILRVGRV